MIVPFIITDGQDNILDVFQVRRELYAQCFEELIRQTLLSSLERGLLLLRVRDEFRWGEFRVAFSFLKRPIKDYY